MNQKYLVDNGIISNDFDRASYTFKLPGNVLLTSGLGHKITKNRLIMMTKFGSGRLIYRVRISMTLILVLIFFLLLSFKESTLPISTISLLGQGTKFTQGVVRGIVLKDDRKPLSGVSISVSDDSVRIKSDKDGRFVINGVREHALLLFSYPGYKTYYQTISFGALSGKELIIKLKKDDIYENVEKMPEYPGGRLELMKFVANNTNYPEVAKSVKAQGKVIVRFIVNTNGKVEEAEVIQSVHPLLDAEALRVVKTIKGFIPGSHRGKPVKVYYMVPFTFNLP